MLLEITKQTATSIVGADRVGLSVVVTACETLLNNGPTTIDQLWDGEVVDLPRYAE